MAAHPDDEIIGLGGALLPRMKPPITIMHVTDGAPANPQFAQDAGFAGCDEYANARRQEVLAALALAGIPESRCITLNIKDQNASFELGRLTSMLSAIFDRIRPAVIFTHSYEGGHPDHDATAFAVHTALKLQLDNVRPTLVEFTSYHMGDGGLQTGDFLPDKAIPTWTFELDAEDSALKCRMFECFASQKHVLRQFGVEAEKIRVAPDYDFMDAPHPGTLYYEQYDWGIQGPLWRRMAADALNVMGLNR